MTLALQNRESLTQKDLKTLGAAVADDDGSGPDKGPAAKGNRAGPAAGKAPKPDMTPHPLPGEAPEEQEEAQDEPDAGAEGAPDEAGGDEGAPPKEADGDEGGDPADGEGDPAAGEDRDGAEGDEEAPEGAQAGQEGQPKKRLGQKERLRQQKRELQERNAALEAEVAMLSGLYPSAGAPSGQPNGQQAPAPQHVPVQATEDPWTRVDDKTLRGVLDGTVAADEAQKAFAVAEFARRVATNAVNQRFNEAGLQGARAQAEGMARREYPECFTKGNPAKVIYDHLMKIHPAAQLAPDAPLLLAGVAIGRAMRLGMAGTRREVVGLKTQVRKARAAGALESGSPAPQGQGVKQKRDDRQRTLQKAALSGRNWYRGKDTNRVVTDLL